MTSSLQDLDSTSPVSAVTCFDPLTAEPGDDLHALARKMRDGDCSALLVQGRDDHVAIVTERDVVRALAEGTDAAWAVDVMSRDLIVVPGDTPIVEATATMIEAGSRHLAVARADGMIGITSIRDLAAVLVDCVD
jgi:CBS domain-containing protein